ncbi:hypothetical protein [Nocardia sp. NPDC127526]|uniref:hypothetical protein n=1 Tax=Nocardia sp. NPDC127526 TaxID=3345393 RepID=UPI0036336528
MSEVLEAVQTEDVAAETVTVETIAPEADATEAANTRTVCGCLVEAIGPGVYEVFRAGMRLGGLYETPQGVYYNPEIANARTGVADSVDVAVLELKRAIESAPAPKRAAKVADPGKAAMREIVDMARVRFAAEAGKVRAADAAYRMEHGPRGKVALAEAAVKRAADALSDKGPSAMRYFRLNTAEDKLAEARELVEVLKRSKDRAAEREDQAKATLADMKARAIENLGLRQADIDDAISKVKPKRKAK